MKLEIRKLLFSLCIAVIIFISAPAHSAAALSIYDDVDTAEKLIAALSDPGEAVIINITGSYSFDCDIEFKDNKGVEINLGGNTIHQKGSISLKSGAGFAILGPGTYELTSLGDFGISVNDLGSVFSTVRDAVVNVNAEYGSARGVVASAGGMVSMTGNVNSAMAGVSTWCQHIFKRCDSHCR